MTRHLTDEERGPFGARLVHARDALNLDQETVAKKAKLSIGALRNMETGKTRRPHQDTLKRLAKVLKVEVSYLTGEVGSDELQNLRNDLKELRELLETLVSQARG